jgi:hypothetical protein
MDGVRVPAAGEVGWWVEGRWLPVWQGTVQHIDHVEAPARD